MAEDIYEWDCDNIKQMCRDLEKANEDLKRHIDKYGAMKEALTDAWLGPAGAIIKEKLEIDFDGISSICKGVEGLIFALNRASKTHYPNCDDEIRKHYNSMQNSHQ